MPWAEFEQRYRHEMLEERSDVLEHLRALEREHGVLTLLCHERIPPAEHCHRQVLAALLAEQDKTFMPVAGRPARSRATGQSDP